MKTAIVSSLMERDMKKMASNFSVTSVENHNFTAKLMGKCVRFHTQKSLV